MECIQRCRLCLQPPNPPYKRAILTPAFQTLLLDLAPVLIHADKHQVLSADVVPEAFHEPNPESIVTAYHDHIARVPQGAKISVSLKLLASNYSSPYDLFHDLVVASAAAIIKHEVGSETYLEIDAFHKSVTKLLLRESEELGTRLVQDNDSDEEDSLGIFRDDFDKILKSYMASNGEFITHVNKYDEPVAHSYHNSYTMHGAADTTSVSQPLFSGLTGRSSLDPRSTVVADPWLLSKAVGCGPNTSLSGPIRAFRNPISKISLPSEANSQIMQGFFHPNWYTIESPKWLQYKQKTLKPPLDSTLVKNCEANELRVFEKKSNVLSIGPSVDSRNAVLGSDIKQAVWFSHLGSKKLADITHEYNGSKPEEPKPESESEETIEPEDKNIAEEQVQLTDAETASGQVKLENLAQYDPEDIKVLAELKEHKSQIVRSPLDMQKAISKRLLRLNRLRQERYLHSPSPSDPTNLEKALFKQIAKLLFLVAKSKASNGKILTFPVSKMVPVLMNDYQGTLPGPVSSQPTIASKSGRLASLRAPHKRRSGRFT